MQPKFLTVDEYIASYPNDIQSQLNELRTIIKNTSPEIEEKLSWGAPTYYYHGYLLQFACGKKHLGFYTTPTTIKYFQEELKPYKTNAKNTTQFPLGNELPKALIEKMVLFRIKENLETMKKE